MKRTHGSMPVSSAHPKISTPGTNEKIHGTLDLQSDVSGNLDARMCLVAAPFCLPLDIVQVIRTRERQF